MLHLHFYFFCDESRIFCFLLFFSIVLKHQHTSSSFWFHFFLQFLHSLLFFFRSILLLFLISNCSHLMKIINWQDCKLHISYHQYKLHNHFYLILFYSWNWHMIFHRHCNSYCDGYCVITYRRVVAILVVTCFVCRHNF